MRRHCLKPVEARLAMFLARGPFANLASFIVWDKADMTSGRERKKDGQIKTKKPRILLEVLNFVVHPS